MKPSELTPTHARGKVAKSESGVLGIILEYRHHPTFTGWEGICLDGGVWRATRPTVVADNVLRYIESTIAGIEAQSRVKAADEQPPSVSKPASGS